MTIKSLSTMFILLPALILISCSSHKETVQEWTDSRSHRIEFSSWSNESKVELDLLKEDVLQVSIKHDSGQIALRIFRLDGLEAYTGQGLGSCFFTVGIPEQGRYVILVQGKKASGRVEIKSDTI